MQIGSYGDASQSELLKRDRLGMSQPSMMTTSAVDTGVRSFIACWYSGECQHSIAAS